MADPHKQVSRFTAYLGYGEAGKELLAQLEAAAKGNKNRFVVDAIKEKLAKAVKPPKTLI